MERTASVLETGKLRVLTKLVRESKGVLMMQKLSACAWTADALRDAWLALMAACAG